MWFNLNRSLEGTMSQILYLGLRFDFMSKNGSLLVILLKHYFLDKTKYCSHVSRSPRHDLEEVFPAGRRLETQDTLM